MTDDETLLDRLRTRLEETCAKLVEARTIAEEAIITRNQLEREMAGYRQAISAEERRAKDATP